MALWPSSGQILKNTKTEGDDLPDLAAVRPQLTGSMSLPYG
jgi:hypothetical protein